MGVHVAVVGKGTLIIEIINLVLTKSSCDHGHVLDIRLGRRKHPGDPGQRVRGLRDSLGTRESPDRGHVWHSPEICPASRVSPNS